MRRLGNGLLLGLLSLVMVSRSAYGIAMLMLDDGAGHVATITDNGGCVGTCGSGDLASGTTGVIIFTGTLGVWDLNLTVGTSKPGIGSATTPAMDIHSTDHSTAAGTLTIKFTDDNFGPMAAGSTLEYALGGTQPVGADARYKILYDAANGSFTGVQIGDTGVNNSSGSFSSPTTGFFNTSPIAGAAPFSLTQIVTITHSQGDGTGFGTNFDASLQSPIVPEPSALLLLGSGLAGFGYLRRRVFKR